jgi:tRNA A-37 threonylcarbamoyl transferase component Bud32
MSQVPWATPSRPPALAAGPGRGYDARMAQLLQAGQRIGGYEVEALIGRGGMGEVYRARQLSMDRHVALKVLSPRLARQDPQFARQFVDEARAAGRLNHANIIHVHDVGKAVLEAGGEDVHYFSMELVEGESVKDVLRREGTVADDYLVLVMNGMAEALCYAESVGIIHRDIKPDNIMVTAAREVKLADLGLAMQAGAEAETGKDGGKAKVMGTPLYMSPEQARAATLDHRSDQYSLGATLFHMLTGEPPYPGGDARAIMRSHVFDEVPDPTELRPEVSKAWARLCVRLLAKDPDDRFRTAAELRAAVRAAAGHGGGHGPGARRHAGRPAGRAWLVPAAAAAAVAVAGLAAWLVMRPGQPPADPAQAIAALPADDAAARQRLQQLIQDERTWDATARARFSAELQRRSAPKPPPSQTTAQTTTQTNAQPPPAQPSDAAKAKALAEALAAISADLSAGDLASAQSKLDALALTADDRPRWQAADPVRRSVMGAVMQAGAAWRKRIGVADGAGVDALAAELAAAKLPTNLRGELDRLLNARRDAVARQQATAAEHAALAAWRQLYADLDAKRCTDRFVDLKSIIEAATPGLPAQDQVHGPVLAGVGKAVQNAESALRLAVRGGRPVVDAVIGGQPSKARLSQISATTITWQPAEGGAEVQTPRSAFACSWDAPLTKALAEAEVEDPVATKAAFLWFWRDAGTAEAIAALGDAPLGLALARLESAGRALPTAAPALWKDGRVQVLYDFQNAGAARYLADFTPGGSAGPGGLRWTTDAKRGDREDQVPGLRWTQTLRPPMSAAITCTIDPEAIIAVGVSAGGRTARLVLSSRSKSTARAGLIVTNAGGGFDLLPLRPDVQPTARMAITWTIAADGQVGLTAAGVDLSAALAGRSLPAGAPATVVVQTMQQSGTSGVVVHDLTLSGGL